MSEGVSEGGEGVTHYKRFVPGFRCSSDGPLTPQVSKRLDDHHQEYALLRKK